MGVRIDAPIPLPTEEFWLRHAINIIQTDYGDTISTENKNKDLLKFGRSTQVQTTKTTIMDLPAGTFNETYVSSNLITTISSSSGSDTTTVVVEGHTVSGGVFTFVTQTVTLTGQTQVTLGTALARCTRIYASGATDLVGTIYVYQDDTSTAGVPDTDSKVHCIITAGENQSFKCSTTISNTDYWLIKNFGAATLKKSAGFAEFTLEMRLADKVFRPVVTIAAGSGDTSDHNFEPWLIVPKNSDIRVRAIADVNGTDCSAHLDGVLAKVIA